MANPRTEKRTQQAFGAYWIKVRGAWMRHVLVGHGMGGHFVFTIAN